MLNLRSVDLNLLPIFEAAYEERSLSRAAERLAMTQPAVSHALSRLRALFRDELFVRQARGVITTPVAEAIYGKLDGALAAIRDAVTESRGFDPKTSERKFFVAIPHPLGPMIAVRLRERLAKVAPSIGIAFSTRSRPVDLERGLREGRVDAAVDWLVPAGRQFRHVALFEDQVVAVVRKGHPVLRGRAKGQGLGDLDFVTLRPRVEGATGLPGIDEWRRSKLKVGLEVSEIVEVFMVVHESDMCGLIPGSMARAAHDLLGLRVLPASPKTAAVPVLLIWHASREPDKAHAFLREQLTRTAREIAA